MGSQDDEHRTLIEAAVTVRNMTQLRTHLLRVAAQAGLPPQRAQAFAVAVHEAVINAIEHAGGCGELTVVQDDEHRLIAEVSDTGSGMPCSIRLTRPPPQATRGRGMWLAGELADHVDVRGDQDGSTVRIEMDLQTP
jgi:anti-sigma regulatory factor (Ser/Thr protein kinase)